MQARKTSQLKTDKMMTLPRKIQDGIHIPGLVVYSLLMDFICFLVSSIGVRTEGAGWATAPKHFAMY